MPTRWPNNEQQTALHMHGGITPLVLKYTRAQKTSGYKYGRKITLNYYDTIEQYKEVRTYRQASTNAGLTSAELMNIVVDKKSQDNWGDNCI